MNYLLLKHFHMSFAAISGLLFLLRGLWMLADSPALQRRWVRVLPHLVDTALLLSAVSLAVWSAQYPLLQTWLSVKVGALLLYIVLGSIALKRGRSKPVRAAAYVAALVAFGYIVGVAVTKNPRLFA
ncbi:SirB2 family protein [Noviherbaspirillum sp. 1P10PC]|uniref:SirB2 family protein n=1 Tax=Noviherbaspirillum sp. 1P10PC TaxID=3132292 RepID=UPI00399F502C